MPLGLVLLCAGGTASARRGGFPDPAEPLDAGGLEKARRLRLEGGAPAACFAAPSRAAGETATALGLAAVAEPALRDVDYGEWAGLSLDAIPGERLAAWLAAPEAGTPGGEGLAAVAARIAPWLDCLRGRQGRVLAITHAGVIRAALAHLLALPVAATPAIDVAPLAAAYLSFTDRWRLQELRRA